MKNIFFHLLLILTLLAAIGCSKQIDSQWKNSAIEIDGKGHDWENIPMEYDEDIKVMYGLANNDSTISLMLRFNDSKLAGMFAMRGVTLWFNDKKEKEKTIGIHYEDESVRSGVWARGRARGRDENLNMDINQKAINANGEFTLARDDSLTGITLDELAGWEAAAGYDDGLYCFEFAVPLTSQKGGVYFLDAQNSKQIKIALEIASMSEEEIKAMKERMEQMRGSGGKSGGRGSGGMAGGMRGAGPQMPDTDGEEIWITVTLAKE